MTIKAPLLLIFARTKKEADAYAMGDLGLNRNEYRYISDPNQLRGCPRDSFYVKLYKWYDNKNTRELDEIDLLLRAYMILPSFRLQKSIDDEKLYTVNKNERTPVHNQ